MRTVKVRILPPQPNLLSQPRGEMGVGRSNTGSNNDKSQTFPFDALSPYPGENHGSPGGGSRCIACARPKNLVVAFALRRVDVVGLQRPEAVGKPGSFLF
jgi:hypothetical protein